MLFGIKMKRTKGNIGWTMLLVALLLSATVCMLTACSSDDTNTTSSPTNNPAEISFMADVWKMAEGTRAATYDNAYLQSQGFVCTAYNAGTATLNTEANINETSVTWNNEDSRWVFYGGPRYWPATGDLDFFAYAPASGSCIIDLIYSSGPQVTFSCSALPVTSSGQSSVTEFVYALTEGQNKTNAASGVSLSFIHPFTLIKLQLAAGHPAIHINTITFKSIKNNGSYNTGTWTPSGDPTDFVWTFNADYDNHESVNTLALGGSYLVIPQNWTGEIEVEAVWNVWGESKTNTVTATVPTTWVAGRSYTYTFTISETDLKVDTEKFTEQW